MGQRIWTADADGNSVSWFVIGGNAQVTFSGFHAPFGIVFDGSNVWVSNFGDGTSTSLQKLNDGATVIQDVTVGHGPSFLCFDGANIWVPNFNDNTISVVRASTGQVVATLTGNGLDHPTSIAFDGQRIMVANEAPGHTLSLWQATDFTPLGIIALPSLSGNQLSPFGICSDGLDFWIAGRWTSSGTSKATALKY
jgi:DNA-binding beta-propeller fold protein YncE